MEKKRVYYIEVLRAIAAMAVVFIHVSSKNWYGYVGSADWTAMTMYSGLVRFCVPVFFMISGALFLKKEKELNIKRLFTHNIFRLVVFLVFWSSFYQVLHLIMNGGAFNMGSIWEMIKNILKGNTEVAFWFLYAMIGMYLIVPIIKGYTSHASKSGLQYFLALWFVFCSLILLIYKIPRLTFIANNLIKLDVHMVMGYIGYFVLGHYLAEYPPKAILRKCIYGAGILGVLFSVVMTYKICVSQQIYNEDFFNYLFPTILLWSASVFLFVQTNAKWVERVKPFVQMVSKYSFGIYGVHMFFIYLLWKVGFTTFSFPAILSVPVISLLVFGASTVTVAVLSKIPFVNKWLV